MGTPINEAQLRAVLPAPVTRLSSLIGVLIVLLSFATFIAILFMPKSAGISDSVVQQIITIVQGVLAGYIGWQYGSSQSNAKAAETIAAQSVALAGSSPATPVVTTTTTAAAGDPGASTTTRTATGSAAEAPAPLAPGAGEPSPDPEIEDLRRR